MLKVYVITRSDLPKSLRGVQCGHALANLTSQFIGNPPEGLGEQFQKWINDDRTLVYLRVPDQESLHKLADLVDITGYPIYRWHEPDWNDEFTAFAVYPARHEDMAGFFGSLPLA